MTSSIDFPGWVERGPIHFMGIGGSGMCALAEAVLRAGGRVTGCDLRPGEHTARLESLGARIHEGHDPSHVEDAVALVRSSAVPDDHPEVRAAQKRGVLVLKRARALGGWVNRGEVVAVAGTHGKTSTTAMATEILSAAGMDPTGFVGGNVVSWRANLRYGRSDTYVVEADEYDRSFLELEPAVAVVTNVDADHLDVYGDLAAIRAAFRVFVDSVPPEGRVVVCGDDTEASRLLPRLGGRGYAYGLNAGLQLRAVNVAVEESGSRFDVVEEGVDRGRVRLSVPGTHHVRNALGAAGAARHLGVDWEAIREGLARYRGVRRRFQRLGTRRSVVVIDDYAHHPRELEATLRATTEAYPGRRIVAVFQPHLYSRTRDFHEELGRALSAADDVWITDVYPAREEPIPGVTGELVAEAAQSAGDARVRYHPDLEGLGRAVAVSLRTGDVCLTLGAGSVETVGPAILDALDPAASDGEGADAELPPVGAGGPKHA